MGYLIPSRVTRYASRLQKGYFMTDLLSLYKLNRLHLKPRLNKIPLKLKDFRWVDRRLCTLHCDSRQMSFYKPSGEDDDPEIEDFPCGLSLPRIRKKIRVRRLIMKKQLRNPYLSGILSAILPGTGQIYNQEIVKAWIVLLLFLLLGGTVIGSFIVWIYAIVDSYRTSEHINRGRKRLSLERNSSLAALSSIVCGWGQIYNDQLFKGITMMACFLFFAPTGIGALIMIAYSIFDARYSAEKINSGEIEPPLIKSIIMSRIDDLYRNNPDMAASKESVISPATERLVLSMNKGDYERALFEGKSSLSAGGAEDSELHKKTGKACLYAGNYGFSVLSFIHALELGDSTSELYNNLGCALLSYGKSNDDISCQDMAEKYFSLALEKDGNCHQAEINLINLLIIKGEFTEASERCDSLLEHDRSLWQANHCMGVISFMKGEKIKARELFLDIVKKHSEAWESRVFLGRICEEEGAFGQALSMYEETVNMSPPPVVKKGLTGRIKRLSSPERKIFRMVFKEKEVKAVDK